MSGEPTLLTDDLEPVERNLLGRRDGATYSVDDEVRLNGQMLAVFRAMRDGEWRTLHWISRSASMSSGRHCSEASVSARLRDLRKPQFGSHVVERRHVGDGLWEYRLEVTQ